MQKGYYLFIKVIPISFLSKRKSNFPAKVYKTHVNHKNTTPIGKGIYYEENKLKFTHNTFADNLNNADCKM